ncbi:helix-turn-helix transcriptional regulator [Zavarzinia sp. CC-PAN008]|uniref:helix-turn-helix transcriptional regulator n=1 Tax=Zavarzinia sp. CC-PAN008 TaxID=3243332 RepID=UPI003F749A62
MPARADPSQPEQTPDGQGDDAAYLRRLGERVREARARRGMTRRILARDSNVSERYLAQLEGGTGNGSILLLRQVARAMNVTLEDLVRDGPDWPMELDLLVRGLAALPAEDLARARAALADALGPSPVAERTRLIALVGLRGAGKSTLGRRLATALGRPFVELDEAVAVAAGLSLGELLDLYGQATYRRYERQCLEDLIAADQPVVIATGGSIVAEAATFERLLGCCCTIWIKAAPEEHMGRVVAQGDFRPMAEVPQAMADLKRILASRTSLYARADAIVDTTGRQPDDSFATLLAAVQSRLGP